jgi:hypothetical protein
MILVPLNCNQHFSIQFLTHWLLRAPAGAIRTSNTYSCGDEPTFFERSDPRELRRFVVFIFADEEKRAVPH